LRNPAHQREQQGKHEFGGRDGIAGRRIEDSDAASRRCLDIDVVHTDARASDDTQPIHVLQNFARDPRRTANDHRVCARQRLSERSALQTELFDDFEAIVIDQRGKARRREWIGNDNTEPPGITH
jgi:hypothetical protein